MNQAELDQFCRTKTLTEKIYEIFETKFVSFARHREHHYEYWKDYLKSIDKIEHIYRFSAVTDTSDHLLNLINKEPFTRMIIRDPSEHYHHGHRVDGRRENYIIIDRDFANVVLALGELP
jgi:hypothetical protein